LGKARGTAANGTESDWILLDVRLKLWWLAVYVYFTCFAIVSELSVTHIMV
jgi:hypothetical protein